MLFMSLTKKNFVLRINEQTYIALEKWAAEEFRSVNGQIEMLLDRALKEAGKKKDTSVTLVKQKR